MEIPVSEIKCRTYLGPGAHQASYPMGTGSSFPGSKPAGTWSWPLTSILCPAQKCVELYLHHQYIFMAWRL